MKFEVVVRRGILDTFPEVLLALKEAIRAELSAILPILHRLNFWRIRLSASRGANDLPRSLGSDPPPNPQGPQEFVEEEHGAVEQEEKA